MARTGGPSPVRGDTATPPTGPDRDDGDPVRRQDRRGGGDDREDDEQAGYRCPMRGGARTRGETLGRRRLHVRRSYHHRLTGLRRRVRPRPGHRTTRRQKARGRPVEGVGCRPLSARASVVASALDPRSDAPEGRGELGQIPGGEDLARLPGCHQIRRAAHPVGDDAGQSRRQGLVDDQAPRLITRQDQAIGHGVGPPQLRLIQEAGPGRAEPQPIRLRSAGRLSSPAPTTSTLARDPRPAIARIRSSGRFFGSSLPTKRTTKALGSSPRRRAPPSAPPALGRATTSGRRARCRPRGARRRPGRGRRRNARDTRARVFPRSGGHRTDAAVVASSPPRRRRAIPSAGGRDGYRPGRGWGCGRGGTPRAPAPA